MKTRRFTLPVTASVALVVLVATARGDAEGQRMVLSSSDFVDGDPIPATYSCDGPGTSPELHWSSAPSGTQSFALVVRDPDARGGGFVHWVIYDIPSATDELPRGVTQGGLPVGAVEGTNGKGTDGWTPPCPHRGTHHYHFELYALDSQTPFIASPTESGLLSAIRGHLLAKADLVGTYAKSG